MACAVYQFLQVLGSGVGFSVGSIFSFAVLENDPILSKDPFDRLIKILILKKREGRFLHGNTKNYRSTRAGKGN